MIKLKETLKRVGTSIILVFFQVSLETYTPIPEQSRALKTRRRDGGQLQSLQDHHTKLWGHPLLFIMYVLCYIFYPFPFLHKKYINIFLL